MAEKGGCNRDRGEDKENGEHIFSLERYFSKKKRDIFLKRKGDGKRSLA